jgi:hypothetical protein
MILRRAIALFLVMSVFFTAQSQQRKGDSVIVRSYRYIPVFYRSKPVHAFSLLGYESRTVMVNNASQGLDQFVQMADRDFIGCTGIIVNDLTMNSDTFAVIRFKQDSRENNIGVQQSDVFFNALPSRP